MKFDLKEFNKLIEEDLNDIQTKSHLETEIQELEEKLAEKEKQLAELDDETRVDRATQYFHDYLQHCQTTMALPKKFRTTGENV